MCCSPERHGLKVRFSDFRIGAPMVKALHDLTRPCLRRGEGEIALDARQGQYARSGRLHQPSDSFTGQSCRSALSFDSWPIGRAHWVPLVFRADAPSLRIKRPSKFYAVGPKLPFVPSIASGGFVKKHLGKLNYGNSSRFRRKRPV
jgi:hypothetical protein